MLRSGLDFCLLTVHYIVLPLLSARHLSTSEAHARQEMSLPRQLPYSPSEYLALHTSGRMIGWGHQTAMVIFSLWILVYLDTI